MLQLTALPADALGVHGVWVNRQLVANGEGLLAKLSLAGELLIEFNP